MNIRHFSSTAGLFTLLLLIILFTITPSPKAEDKEDALSPSCKTAECHNDFDTRKNVHDPVKKGNCSACHKAISDTHPNDDMIDFILTDERDEICYACHTDFGKRIKSEPYLHTPVRQKDCSACHDPHGTDYRKLLKREFPEKFRQLFKLENYALCFYCHNKEIVTEKETDRLTNFRNGNFNFHFLHVNMGNKKGASCKTCHKIHAGSQVMLISRVMMCMNCRSSFFRVNRFFKTETGGNCETGCHRRKYYDRVEPVENKK